MASLIFAQAKSIRRKAKAAVKVYNDALEGQGIITDERSQEIYDAVVANELVEFKSILTISRQLHDVYIETTNMVTKNWYFVTISPDTNKIGFDKFKSLVFKKLSSVRISDYRLSFEQRGTTVDTLGTGFHCHFVIETNWRSKAEVLRDIWNLFAAYMVKEAIEVKPTRNPHDIVQKYLIEYESNDDHKKETMEWDALWRKEKGLESLYTMEGDAVIKSVTASDTP